MKRFGLGIFVGLSLVLGGLAAAYGGLATLWPDSLPAPAIGRLVHIDEKLRFIRRHPAIDPAILAVGSSVTWRQIDGQAFEPAAGGREAFFNGGTAYLQAHQTRTMTGFYLDNYPNVRTLMVMTNLPDFENCTTEPPWMLDARGGTRYAFKGWPAAYFYFRFFSPQRYIKGALTLAERRAPFTGDMYLDPYGSGPLDVPEEQKRGLRYDDIKVDPACVEAFLGLRDDLAARGVRLLIVFPPVHPEYRRRYPQAMEEVAAVARRLIEAARDENGMQVLALLDDPTFDGQAFFDAFHLQWPSVRVLSRKIAGTIKPIPSSGDPMLGQTAASPQTLAGRR